MGVYRDRPGNTPVPAAVREAEQAMIAAQTSKTYVGPAGNAEFNERIIELALGPLARDAAVTRIATIQTVGGCGALRLGAELLRVARPIPSSMSALRPGPITSRSSAARGSRSSVIRTTTRLRAASISSDARPHAACPAGAVVLLHACCHNPTGADLSADQWRGARGS